MVCLSPWPACPHDDPLLPTLQASPGPHLSCSPSSSRAQRPTLLCCLADTFYSCCFFTHLTCWPGVGGARRNRLPTLLPAVNCSMWPDYFSTEKSKLLPVSFLLLAAFAFLAHLGFHFSFILFCNVWTLDKPISHNQNPSGYFHFENKNCN